MVVLDGCCLAALRACVLRAEVCGACSWLVLGVGCLMLGAWCLVLGAGYWCLAGLEMLSS